MKVYLVNEDGWASAFADCREKGHPVIIMMVEKEGEEIFKWKIYPSGKAKRI